MVECFEFEFELKMFFFPLRWRRKFFFLFISCWM